LLSGIVDNYSSILINLLVSRVQKVTLISSIINPTIHHIPYQSMVRCWVLVRLILHLVFLFIISSVYKYVLTIQLEITVSFPLSVLRCRWHLVYVDLRVKLCVGSGVLIASLESFTSLYINHYTSLCIDRTPQWTFFRLFNFGKNEFNI